MNNIIKSVLCVVFVLFVFVGCGGGDDGGGM